MSYYIVNHFKKVLSVQISLGSGTFRAEQIKKPPFTCHCNFLFSGFIIQPKSNFSSWKSNSGNWLHRVGIVDLPSLAWSLFSSFFGIVGLPSLARSHKQATTPFRVDSISTCESGKSHFGCENFYLCFPNFCNGISGSSRSPNIFISVHRKVRPSPELFHLGK